MEKLVSVGFGNMVNSSKVIAVISPESAPVKRMVQAAKEAGNAIDVTQGRKTKSVIVMENGQVAAAGNHDQLLKTCDIYQEIYEQQVGGKAGE